jgi:hypothetical protein
MQTETIAPKKKSFWVKVRPSVLCSAEVGMGTEPEDPLIAPVDSSDGGDFC